MDACFEFIISMKAKSSLTDFLNFVALALLAKVNCEAMIWYD